VTIDDASSLATDVPEGLRALVFTRRAPVGPCARLLAVGDIGLSGRVAAAGARCSFDELLSEVAPLLRSGDLAFGNIEFPLVGDLGHDALFAGEPSAAPALRRSGFTVAQVANSHSPDFGPAGLARSIQALSEAGMIPIGAGPDREAAGGLVRTDVRDVRIGWLAGARTLIPQSAPGIRFWEFDEAELMAAIARERPAVDVLVVSIHMGLAYLDHPGPMFKAVGERAMAAGADVVLMHHAHVLQSVQVVPGGQACCYSLGNFLLDWREGNVEIPMMVDEQTEAAVFLFDLDAKGVCLGAALPTYIDPDFHVRWATGSRGDRILGRLERISRDLESDYSEAFAVQRIQRNAIPVLKVLAFHAVRGHWRFVAEQVGRIRLDHVRMLGRWAASRFARRR